jgi:hypothetical protein
VLLRRQEGTYKYLFLTSRNWFPEFKNLEFLSLRLVRVAIRFTALYGGRGSKHVRNIPCESILIRGKAGFVHRILRKESIRALGIRLSYKERMVDA